MRRSTARQGARRGPLRAVLGLFSSVWFGITLMALMFIYCTIASAGLVYPVHWKFWDTQNWAYILPRIYFDLTEMEAFHWWPFLVLLALFCVTLATVTLRRIPLNVINLGVWMIHTGILILVGGSVYYFSTKVEGDTPVFRRQIEIGVPGEGAITRLPAIPGNRISVGQGSGRYDLEVISTNPRWPILSDEDAGKTAYAVQVSVTSQNGSFIRQLLAGYPQYTEDILPGQGRAKKATGKALVDEELQMRLAYLPQDAFFVMDTKALNARAVGEQDWKEHPLDDLPHFQDRIADRDWVWTAPGAKPLRIDPLDRAVSTGGGNDPLAGIDVHVTGFLRYAPEEIRVVPSAEGLRPLVGFTLTAPDQQKSYELESLDPLRNTAEKGTVAFHWVNSIEEIARYERSRPRGLRIRVPSANIDRSDAIVRTLGDDPELAFTPIEDSDYAYRVRSVFDDLPMASGRFAGQTLSVALVDIRTPERTFRRWVVNPPDATRDVSEDNAEIELDSKIVMEYEPGDRAIIILVGGPDPIGLHLFVEIGQAERQHQKLSVGEKAPLRDGLSLEVDHFYRSAIRESRPFVTPIHLRDRNAGAAYSCIRVELRQNNWSRAFWLPFNSYALPDSSYAYRGRILHQPRQIDLPDGRRVELLFSRQRMPLGTQVALDDFELPTHSGGYTGSAITVRDYVSHVRFRDQGAWSAPAIVRNNNPTEHGGWWYFQSTWDPPTGPNEAGMNFTGLGVGNRNGVYIQLVGTVIAVMGMIYAFYVKPVIKRRRRESVWAAAGKSGHSGGNGNGEPYAATASSAESGKGEDPSRAEPSRTGLREAGT